jgi:cytochrome d ubiquinol oxidase subunit I
VVGGVAAYHLLKMRTMDADAKAHINVDAIKKMFSTAMWIAAIVTPIQIFVGDSQGLNTLQYQPLKIAAMEGHFESETPAGLVVFGIPNQEEARMDYKVEIPYLGSLILHHDLDTGLKGYDAFPREDWPPMAPPFFAFRIMVGIGMLMLGIGLWSLVLRKRKRLFDTPIFHKACLLMAPAGFVAVISGWIVTEVGRQPFTVYGLLRTADSVSPLSTAAVATSLIAFIIVYFSMFSAGLVYILRQVRQAPALAEPMMTYEQPTRTGGFVPPSLARPAAAPGAGDD